MSGPAAIVPDDIRMEKGQGAYPYNEVRTLVYELVSDPVAVMVAADDYADRFLEDARNEDASAGLDTDLDTLSYGYVWREGETDGPPFAFGYTFEGYRRFTGLGDGPFYMEVEVRLHESV